MIDRWILASSICKFRIFLSPDIKVLLFCAKICFTRINQLQCWNIKFIIKYVFLDHEIASWRCSRVIDCLVHHPDLTFTQAWLHISLTIYIFQLRLLWMTLLRESDIALIRFNKFILIWCFHMDQWKLVTGYFVAIIINFVYCLLIQISSWQLVSSLVNIWLLKIDFL